MSTRESQLGTEDIRKLLLRFSVPAIIGMLMSALYNIVDRIYIGKIQDVGHYALTGVGLTFPFTNIILGFGMLIGIGAAARISLRLGEQKKDEAEHVLGNAVTLVALFSVVIMVVGHLLLEPVLYAFGASDITFPFAKEYMRIILWGVPFQMIAFSLNHPIRSAGNPRRFASTQIVGAITNVILDPIFIFVFDMGIAGAALATIISQAVSAAWVLLYYFGKTSNVKIRKVYLKTKIHIVMSIFAIGVSPFIMQVAASMINVVANRQLLVYGGDLAVGAMTVINSVSTIFFMPVFGINQGAQPIIGYNYGAEQFGRVKRAYKYAVSFAVGWMVFGLAIIQFATPWLVLLFNNDPELMAISVYGMRRYLCIMPFAAFQIVSANYYSSVGRAKIAMFLSLLRQVLLLLPLYYILPYFFGLNGIWFAGPVSDALAVVMTATFIWREMRDLNRRELIAKSNISASIAST